MKLIKYILMLLIIVLLMILVVVIGLGITRPSVADIPMLKNGDLVFQTMSTPQSLPIMLASHTAYSHIGMIKLDDAGSPLVVEAVGPVREIDLDAWIHQGIGGRITIKRITELSEVDAQKALNAARAYYGLPYDVMFLLDRGYIYCSELVYYAFKDAIGLELGKVERIEELYVDNWAVQSLIKSRWRAHPICQAEASDFESCYALVMKQELVTPDSIAEDTRVETIYSNYGVFE